VKLSAIDLNILVALDVILSERNVTRAAARLGRSQPATSHALSRARDLFKDPLLVRIRGGLELTARARAIAPKIRRLLGELGAVLDDQKNFDPAAIETLNIGATDYVGCVLLPHLVQILRRRAPRLSVRVRSAEGPDALDPVVSGLVDVAVGTFPQVPVGLRAEELFEDEFVCLRRKLRGRARQDGKRMTVDRFAALGHVLVASPSIGQGPVDHALARAGKMRQIAVTVPQFLVAPSIVAETDLVLTTGRRIAGKVASALGLEVFTPPVSLKPFAVRMIWHPRTENDSFGQWLRSTLREAASLLRPAGVSRGISNRNV
jgi:DNA-binding transcriptional LysR family regulator